MNPAQLNVPIVIKQQEHTLTDNGAISKTLTKVHECGARITQLSSRELWQAEAAQVHEAINVDIRFYPGITVGMYVLIHGDEIYKILQVDPGRNRTQLERLKCVRQTKIE